MWKKPYRKNNAISQSFGSGLVTVYAVEDEGKPGLRPVKLLNKKFSLAYENQKLGIQRFYSGQQNQVEIQRVIRCPNPGRISTQDVAITEDGTRYCIHMIQMVPDVYPESIDLTLSRITHEYDKAEVIKE